LNKTKYYYVPILIEVAELVDQAVDANKYPLGKYRSRAHYILVAVKELLRKEGFLGEEGGANNK